MNLDIELCIVQGNLDSYEVQILMIFKLIKIRCTIYQIISAIHGELIVTYMTLHYFLY